MTASASLPDPLETSETFNDLSSPGSYLASRRSGKPKELIQPGPTDEQISRIVAMALRTPDHGKLAPWRVVHVLPEQRPAMAQMLRAAYSKEKPDAGHLELEAMDLFAHQAPQLLTILSSPHAGSHIPLWEQELSVGAFCMNVLHAAHSMGFHAGWLTAWAAFNDDVRNAFGQPHEKIAGFIYIGTSKNAQSERPRPDISDVLSVWDGGTKA